MLLDVNPAQSRSARVGMAGITLALLLLLAGCEAPSSAPPGAKPGMGGAPGAPGAGNGFAGKTPKTMGNATAAGQKQGVTGAKATPSAKPLNPLPGGLEPAANAIPSPASLENPLAPVTKVEQAGNPVELASLLLVLETNPFLDRLPKPQIEVMTNEEGETIANVQVPADPFESVSLLGIVYHPKNPLALIMVSGGVNQSQMARKGDILMMDGGQMKVSKIQPDSIELQLMGKGAESRTLSLPDMVGYTSNSAATPSAEGGGAGGASQASNGVMGASPTPASAAPAGTAVKSKSDLGNLRRITGQQSGKSGIGTAPKQAGGPMNLMEPGREVR